MSARLYTGAFVCLAVGSMVVWGLLGSPARSRRGAERAAARDADRTVARAAEPPVSSCDAASHDALLRPLIARSDALGRRVEQLERELRALRSVAAGDPAPRAAAPTDSGEPTDRLEPAESPARWVDLDSALRQEASDPAWESALALELDRRLRDPSGGSELAGVECGHSFCRVEVVHEGEQGVASIVDATQGLAGVRGVTLSPPIEREGHLLTVAYVVRDGQSSDHPALQ